MSGIDGTPHPPTIGRIVIYKSKTGRYVLPALISAVQSTLYRPAVEGGHVPDLDSEWHVHLSVHTPGIQGERLPDTDPGIKANAAGGTYQEHNIPFDPDGGPGTWSWPPRV